MPWVSVKNPSKKSLDSLWADAIKHSDRPCHDCGVKPGIENMTTDNVKELYYDAGIMTRDEFPYIINKMIENGKDYFGLVPDKDGNLISVIQKFGKETFKDTKMQLRNSA